MKKMIMMQVSVGNNTISGSKIQQMIRYSKDKQVSVEDVIRYAQLTKKKEGV